MRLTFILQGVFAVFGPDWLLRLMQADSDTAVLALRLLVNALADTASGYGARLKCVFM